MKKYIHIVLLVCVAGFIKAQQNLPGSVVQVVKDFEARLDETEKIKVNPELPYNDTSKIKYRYEVNPGIQELKYSAPQIRPIQIKAAEPIPVYPFYLKAGYGIPQEAYGRLSYSFSNDARTKIGIDLTHLSANNTKKNNAQRFYDNDLKGHILYLTEEGMAIQGDAFVSKDRYYHYGHYVQNPTTQTPNAILKHDYDLFDISAKIFNPKISANGLNYFAGVGVSALVDNLNSKEKGANIHLGVTKWIKDKHSLSIELGTDFNSLKDSATQELNNFYVLPSIGIHGKSFVIQAGLRVTSHNDEIALFPVVSLSGSIAGNQLMVIAGAEGGLNKNTYRTLSTYNPFITSRPILVNNASTDYYAGIKGSASTLEYDARVGYKTNDQLPLFILNTQNFNRFSIIYRDINIIHGTASVTYRPSKAIVINGAVNKNVFRNNIEANAWGLPSLEVNGSIQYLSLNKKLLLTGETFVNDGIPFKDDSGISGKSKLLLDVSLGADYHITKNFGLFVQANNLANSTWRRWYQYPTLGLNAVGGITVKF
ncbi:MAG: hypothetical protein ABI761_01960 [Saprospiraceae bacterium]